MGIKYLHCKDLLPKTKTTAYCCNKILSSHHHLRDQKSVNAS